MVSFGIGKVDFIYLIMNYNNKDIVLLITVYDSEV